MKDALHKSLSAKTIFLVGLGFALVTFLATGKVGFPLFFLALALVALARERKNKTAIQNGLEPEDEKHIKHGGLIALGLFLIVIIALGVYMYSVIQADL